MIRWEGRPDPQRAEGKIIGFEPGRSLEYADDAGMVLR